MTPWTLIQRLEKDNSRLYKEELLKTELFDTEMQMGLLYALDPLVTFGIKQIPISEKDGPGLTWDKFNELAVALKTRNLTGNAAKDAVQATMDIATQKQWNNWYRRILLKDLRCGVSEKTINKVAQKIKLDFEIPRFGCMLATDGLKKEGKLAGECLLENKYDGVRAIAIVRNAVCTLYSRNGKILPNFPHIEKALSKVEYDNTVFDGEVMSDDFQALMKQVYRKSDVDTNDAYLALFDVLSYEDWLSGGCDLEQLERKEILDSMSFDDCVIPVGYKEVDLDTEEGQQTFSEINKEAIERGFEGLMVKPVTGKYECKRSDLWLKIKPFIEVTLSIVDIEEGTGKNEGITGALVCEGTDDGTFIQVKVGSGLTDQLRQDTWDNKDEVIGQLVEIRADAVTQNQDGTFSLRFPRFKTFRGFELGEKL